MKKIISLFIAILIALWANLVFAQELDEAVKFMHDNGMTKYVTVTDYKSEDSLTREQTAKIMVEFSSKILWKIIPSESICSFADLNQSDPEFRNYIEESCTMWIFKWKIKDGVTIFDPKANISKAEFITVLVRTLKWIMDEDNSPWWIKYYQDSMKSWVLTNPEITNNIARWEAALMLYRSASLYGTIGSSSSQQICGTMWYNEALEIAKSSCTAEWNLASTYMCNDNSNTWWFDMDISKDGCAPACVVDTKTGTAEINWRCTGLATDDIGDDADTITADDDTTSDQADLETLLDEMIK